MKAKQCTLICFWSNGKETDGIQCQSISEAKKIASTARTEGGCVRYEIWDSMGNKVTQGKCN